MQPIDKLLARIKWDKEFGNAAFAIGYYDRVAARILRRPLADLLFEPGNKESFLLMDEEGVYQPDPPAPGARGVPQQRADLAAAKCRRQRGTPMNLGLSRNALPSSRYSPISLTSAREPLPAVVAHCRLRQKTDFFCAVVA